METDRKIHVSKAPPSVQATAEFINQAHDKGYNVKAYPQSPNGSVLYQATNGETTVYGTVEGNTGKLTISS